MNAVAAEQQVTLFQNGRSASVSGLLDEQHVLVQVYTMSGGSSTARLGAHLVLCVRCHQPDSRPTS